MSKYTTRIVLHDVADLNNDAYKKLHELMTRAGFKTTITGADGLVYHMPPAEYNYESDEDRNKIREIASKIASQVGGSYGVLVTEGARSWQGLRQVI